MSTSTSAISWSNEDGSTVSQGLNPFGISQENGVLRVYPVTLLSEGTNTFSCSDGGLETLTVQFDRRKCNVKLISRIGTKLPAPLLWRVSIYVQGHKNMF